MEREEGKAVSKEYVTVCRMIDQYQNQKLQEWLARVEAAHKKLKEPLFRKIVVQPPGAPAKDAKADGKETKDKDKEKDKENKEAKRKERDEEKSSVTTGISESKESSRQQGLVLPVPIPSARPSGRGPGAGPLVLSRGQTSGQAPLASSRVHGSRIQRRGATPADGGSETVNEVRVVKEAPQSRILVNFAPELKEIIRGTY